MEYQASDIRELVEQGLTTEQLKDLLFDNFRSVYDNTEDQSRAAKIRSLVDYAQRQRAISTLLKAIKKFNPNAYEKFVLKLGIAEEPEVNQGSTIQMDIEPITKTDKESEVKTCDVLVLAANPSGMDMLDLEKEANLIRSRLQEGKVGKSFVVQVERAVQVTDLSKFLLQYKPLIVHFSGHGSANGEIILNNDQGQAHALAPEQLAELLAIVRERLECVILNACFSLEIADALVDQVRCLIGMDTEIDDESAVRFAAGFYRGLGSGMNYYKAFELGRNEINLSNLPDVTVPQFITRDTSIMQSEPRKTRTANFSAPQPTTPLYSLWFGTNRKPIVPEDISKGFSAERERQIHYGTCQVAVPKSHKIGSVGTPWWQFTLTDDRLKLERQSLKLLNEASFFDSIKQALEEHDLDEHCALVFIHGFNVNFEQAAMQAAQMGVDLQLQGIMAFYSWPSKAKLTGYPADEETIQASERYIAEFLLNLAQKSGVKKVHIIAHSMGNRGLLMAMQRILAQVQATSNVSFGQIFLAAPDVDPDIFQELAGAYQKLSERTTLYVSSKDKALATSGIIHREPRVGFFPPITVMDGIDTVEVSNIDITWLGHGYFADARTLLQDIHELLIHNTSPESRFGLRSRQEGDQTYWQIGK
jgi:esterase/lipase superfamily enzyme